MIIFIAMFIALTSEVELSCSEKYAILNIMVAFDFVRPIDEETFQPRSLFTGDEKKKANFHLMEKHS